MKHIKSIFLLSFSGILLFLVFRKVDRDDLYAALSDVPLSFISVSLLLVGISVYAKMRRWKSLVSILKKDIKSTNILSSNCIGFLSDQILPAKAGELIRSFLLGNKENISSIAVLGTSIIERVLDLFAVLLITGSVLFFLETESRQIVFAQSAGVSFVALALVGII